MDLTMHSVETLQRPHHPHRPTVWSFIQDHYSLILIPFTSASVTSERGVVCQEVKQLLFVKGMQWRWTQHAHWLNSVVSMPHTRSQTTQRKRTQRWRLVVDASSTRRLGDPGRSFVLRASAASVDNAVCLRTPYNAKIIYILFHNTVTAHANDTVK